ncbi:hypothetical protein MPC4_340027 [Methylocella tundrae]|uniref:Uncharacterized protein n=1 Tax=Methylocella tundrae TaxID=227605 RepID=A0A8B6M907_METTU|nr:hypothetical protein MPC1_8140004 [Methylocella tundrae]VTZ51271.1 hypothetical protein MPC4_340027 [Methylocella tundrae]
MAYGTGSTCKRRCGCSYRPSWKCGQSRRNAGKPDLPAKREPQPKRRLRLRRKSASRKERTTWLTPQWNQPIPLFWVRQVSATVRHLRPDSDKQAASYGSLLYLTEFIPEL